MAAGTLQLAPEFRQLVEGLLAEARGALTVISGFRTNAEQIALRKAHCGTSHYDIYDKPPGECSPATARPGESQHEKGLAADLGGDLTLAHKLAPKYGLSFPVAGEAWHVEASSGIAGVAGIPVPPIPNPFGGGTIPNPFDGAGDAIEGWVGDLVSGFRDVAVLSLVVATGVALVVVGANRTVGRSVFQGLKGAS